MLEKTFEFLAPILVDDSLVHEWEPDPYDDTKIIGNWAEDGSKYVITCPPQLRYQIIMLQVLASKLYQLSKGDVDEHVDERLRINMSGEKLH